MKVVNRQEPWLLFVGDIFVFVVSLWLTLFLRNKEIPTGPIFFDHLWPFGILFIIWCLVFFIGGLYEKHTVSFKNRLPIRIIKTQVFNIFLAVAFFYFVPYFGITPKVILFIYIIVSLPLISLWRIYGQKIFGLATQERALILGRGKEMALLLEEVNSNSRYGLEFVSVFDLDRISEINFNEEIIKKIEVENISVVVMDLQNENLQKNLSHFYNLLFSKIRFVNINSLYEDIFDRVPLSLVGYNWFLENISLSTRPLYDTVKRLADLLLAILLMPILLTAFIFVWLVKKLEDTRPIMIWQARIGYNGRVIKIAKFRTWLYDDAGDEELKKKNHITKIGNFLRALRIDELPQVWNVLRGDLSFIGPRPELPVLVKKYEVEIPYYGVRHLIKPGLSGWAQLRQANPPKHDPDFNETKTKLSYDLFYIKNRSLILDLVIVLKTIKTVLSRSGK
jgi:lipopolysaccharide/colanic/teichoic acid biosynthesis glycosyltransferase